MNALEMANIFFEQRKQSAIDIKEHLDILKEYASKSEHVTELGVRAIVSTWAFALGMPKRLVSIDMIAPSFYLNDGGFLLSKLEEICKELGIDFSFVLGNSLIIDIEETDLLFIDTIHSYEHLSKELALHKNKVRKWIIIHDTESAKDYFIDSYGDKLGGMGYALEEFLTANPEWSVEKIFTNNNGLTVLKKENTNHAD